MDFESLAKAITAQFVSVWNAPVPFIVGVLLVWWVISKWFKQSYDREIASLNSRIDLRDDQVRQLERQIERQSDRLEEATTEQEADVVPPTRAEPIVVLSDNVEARVFVSDSTTPELLMDIYKENTSIQADELAKTYLNKWMRISGIVNDVRGYDIGAAISLRGRSIDDDDWRLMSITLYFDRRDRVEALRQGDEIEAIGRIDKFDGLSLRLEDCELA